MPCRLKGFGEENAVNLAAGHARRASSPAKSSLNKLIVRALGCLFLLVAGIGFGFGESARDAFQNIIGATGTGAWHRNVCQRGAHLHNESVTADTNLVAIPQSGLLHAFAVHEDSVEAV